jgi:predicted ATPase/DNA-binding SARP family transcriptional activator
VRGATTREGGRLKRVAAQTIQVMLAGGCRVATVDGTWDVEVPTRQGRLVLARLALAGGPVTRDELADLVWPERLPLAWERDLSAVVSRLRRVLADAPGSAATVRGGSGVYQLILPPGSVIDVVDAEVALDQACAALNDDRLEEALSASRAAADVARLPLVPGANSVWLDDRRGWLRSMLARALAVAVEVAIARRDIAGLRLSDEAIATDPSSERAYENAMRLRLALGEPVAAVETYNRYHTTVVEELGLPAGPALDALVASAQGAASPELASSRASAGSTAAARTGALPIATTSFVGRQRALRELEAVFERSRLVTVTGPAGVGKTRLALEAAHRLVGRRRDGARVCELGHIAHPGDVGAAMAAAIGATPGTGIGVDDSLIEALASRRILVVVDNCEHVLPTVAPLLERIIEHCRGVWVLATSRERLAVGGEAVVALRPLELPEPEADPNAAWARPAPALELLADRIKALRADFAPGSGEELAALVDTCRRLDGLPLAIELAATRMASMAPLDVAQRLEHRLALLTSGRRTAPSRHSTLRAAIEWSHDMLTDDERHVFERAGVFAGGFTLAAAERVCAEEHGLRSDEIANVLAALVDKSLVVLDGRHSATRYQMLETLREFARERLLASDDLDGAARAHAEYFACLAATAELHIRGPSEAEWAALVDAETANFRAAHAWARRSRAVDLAASLSAALAWFSFWRMRTEMLSWAEPLADLAETPRTTRYVEALAAAGRSAWMRGDLARSQALVERAIAATDDESARFAWHVLGDVHLFRGDLRAAAGAYEKADDLGRQAGDAYHCALLRGCRALVCTYAGDTTTALELANESRAEAELSGSPTALAWSDYVTGETLLVSEPEQALDHLERASTTAGRVANEFIAGVAGLSAVSLVARHGDLAQATRTFVNVIDRFERAGTWRQQWTAMRQAVELLGRLGLHQPAAVVLGAVEAADAENIFGDDAKRLARRGDELRAALGESFDAAMRDGRSLDRTDVVAFVRHQLGAERAAAVADTSP